MEIKSRILGDGPRIRRAAAWLLLAALTTAGALVLAACDHNITSSGYVDFSKAKRPPLGLYMSGRCKSQSGDKLKMKTDFPLPGMAFNDSQECLALNLTPGEEGLTRVEFAAVFDLIDTAQKPAVHIPLYRPARISNRVSISHIMDWNGFEYYHFSAAVVDPALTAEPDILEDHRLSRAQWNGMTRGEKLALAEGIAKEYRALLKKEGWPMIRNYKDPDVQRYKGRIANFVFAYNPKTRTLHYLDDVFNWDDDIKKRRKSSKAPDPDSIEACFGDEARYKAWLKQRIRGMAPPAKDSNAFTFSRMHNTPLLQDVKGLTWIFLIDCFENLPAKPKPQKPKS